MGRADPRYLVVGHIDKPHGTKGEIFVSPLTDHPGSVYAPGVVLRLGGSEDDEPDPDLPPLRVEAARPMKKGLLVTFAGIEDRDQADLLRNRYLLLPADAVEPLAEGEVYLHDLIGLTVVTVSGETVGEVAEVYELTPAYMLEVHGGGQAYMIPYTREVVPEVDLEGGRLVIDPPDGLLDL